MSTAKLLKFKICKKEKIIISNLEKVKKEKLTSLVFTRNLLMKTIVTKIHFLSCEKKVRRRSGRYKIENEISCHVAAGTNNNVRKVHTFGVDFGERHVFGIASTVVIGSPRFYI